MADPINKVINIVRGLPNPPGKTGRASVVKYPYYPPNDLAMQEAIYRRMYNIPEDVVVIIVDPNAPPQPMPALPQTLPVPPEQPTAQQKQRLLNLEKARAIQREKRENEQTRQEAIQKQRLKNLKKARKAKNAR